MVVERGEIFGLRRLLIAIFEQIQSALDIRLLYTLWDGREIFEGTVAQIPLLQGS